MASSIAHLFSWVTPFAVCGTTTVAAVCIMEQKFDQVMKASSMTPLDVQDGSFSPDTTKDIPIQTKKLSYRSRPWIYNTIFFRQRLSHFRHRCCFFARPPLFFASLYVLISDRAGAFRHLDFDEHCQRRTVPRFSTVITHGTNLGLIGSTLPRVSPEIRASNQSRRRTLPRLSAELLACHHLRDRYSVKIRDACQSLAKKRHFSLLPSPKP